MKTNELTLRDLVMIIKYQSEPIRTLLTAMAVTAFNEVLYIDAEEDDSYLGSTVYVNLITTLLEYIDPGIHDGDGFESNELLEGLWEEAKESAITNYESLFKA